MEGSLKQTWLTLPIVLSALITWVPAGGDVTVRGTLPPEVAILDVMELDGQTWLATSDGAWRLRGKDLRQILVLKDDCILRIGKHIRREDVDFLDGSPSSQELPSGRTRPDL